MEQSACIILHDYFESAEGGGRLCRTLAESLGLELASGFRIPDHPYFCDFREHVRDLGLYSRLPLWRQLKLIRGFQHGTAFVESYRCALYSGFYSPLTVLRHPATRNLLYCHTPPRFVYDQRDFYFNQVPIWQRLLLREFIRYFQPRYEAAVARMDMIIANSENVRGRIRRYLGRDAEIIHPPCETRRFRWLGQQDYYLSTARLDPLKRIDLLINAFRRMPDKKLVVMSGGSDLRRLRLMASGASNITFTGWVQEERLPRLIGNAIATLYVPRDEDFGMSPVESMAAGKPVVGVAEGGLLETIVHGDTGILLPPEPGIEDVIAAIRDLTPERAYEMRSACETRAKLFRTEVFVEKMRGVLEISISRERDLL